MIFSVGILRLPTMITSATVSLLVLCAWTGGASAGCATKMASSIIPARRNLAWRAARPGPAGAWKLPSIPFIGNPRVGLLWRGHSGGRRLAQERKNVKSGWRIADRKQLFAFERHKTLVPVPAGFSR